MPLLGPDGWTHEDIRAIEEEARKSDKVAQEAALRHAREQAAAAAEALRRQREEEDG